MNIKISGGILNVAEYGNKNARPTLVFLHYFGGSSESWRGLIEKLKKDFYCLAPDLRGFGRSQDVAQNFDLEDYAQDVTELADSIKLENYSLVGHSMGGKIALSIAARQPLNLSSLILLAPSPPSPEPMDKKERRRLQTTHGTTEAAAETIKRASFRKLSEEARKHAIAANLESAEAAWQAWLDTSSRRDISESIKQIDIPVAIAVGEKDDNITAALAQSEIMRHAKLSTLTVIKSAGHLLPLEAPEECADFILESISNRNKHER